MSEESKSMPSLLDREIDSIEADAFGHRHFAKALESLVESPINEPPYSIGLLGKWGTGKSTVKNLYLSSLDNDLGKDKSGKIRKNKFYSITFNAWRFGGENIKRALLRHVFISLGGDESTLKDELFHQLQRTSLEPRAWSDIFRDAWDKWVFSLVQVILVYFVLIGIPLYIIRSVFQLSNEWVIGGIISVFAASGVLLVKYLLDPRRFLIQRYSNITRIEQPRSSAEEYEDLLIEQLKKFKTTKKGTDSSKSYGMICHSPFL